MSLSYSNLDVLTYTWQGASDSTVFEISDDVRVSRGGDTHVFRECYHLLS